jgi:CHAT domain-containing protein
VKSPGTEDPKHLQSRAAELIEEGGKLYAAGRYKEATERLKQALALCERLYSQERSPQGHPELARSLHNLGELYQEQGEYGPARDFLQRALAMQQDLTELFALGASEAEALRRSAAFPRTRDAFLSVARQVPGSAGAAYTAVWRGKGALTRIVAGRSQVVQQYLRTLPPGDTPAQRAEVVRLTKALRDQETMLSRLLLAPGPHPDAFSQQLQQLNTTKEDLERQLAQFLPDYQRRRQLEDQGSAALVARLPAHSAFLDLLRYVRFDQDPNTPGQKGVRRTVCYVAFVLAPGRPVRRVELGEAAPLEQALLAWRQAIQDERPTTRSAELRRLLWEPLARELPAKTETVYLSPDGPLWTLPWPALPGQKPERYLLEEYALALIPHGPFLLEQLTTPPGRSPEGILLAVGEVAYAETPAPLVQPVGDAPARRQPNGQDPKQTWRPLPGAAHELKRLLQLAGNRKAVVRRQTQASVEQVLADLPQARWAHFATHAFFANAEVRSILQLDPAVFVGRSLDQPYLPGARNPLVLSGLVLAGANRPPKPEDPGDRGILTAHAIAGLALNNLELAVLSASETGLGQVAGGEGVYGLQRAFHLAGTRNVMASLWHVDDRATAALMERFYTHLWKDHDPALVALRKAQLAMLTDYDRRSGQLRPRGSQTAKADPEAVKNAAPAGSGPRLLRLYWAGFLLSGDGR